MNITIIKGRLARDPETKTTQSGKSVCTFTVAVDKYGEGANFYRCQAWEKSGEFIQKFFSKGQEILIQGEMDQSHFEKDGEKRDSWQLKVGRVEFCGKKSDSGGSSSADKPLRTDADGVVIEDDDDLPF
jgi:single-strand DNA-binding protein